MQQTEALKLEKQYLTISAIGNVLVACVGVSVAAVSSSQAILLDGLFNLTYFATGLFTVKVASLVAGGDDERFPHGYAFFEPLVNGIKGMLVLGVSVMATHWCGGGVAHWRPPNRGGHGHRVRRVSHRSPVGRSHLTMRHGVKATGSPLVGADAENWIVNAAISSCVSAGLRRHLRAAACLS